MSQPIRDAIKRLASKQTIASTGDPPGPPGYTFGVYEGQQFDVGQYSTWAYGAGGKFVYRNLDRGTYRCETQLWGQGDPYPDVVKACFYKSGPNPVESTPPPPTTSPPPTDSWGDPNAGQGGNTPGSPPPTPTQKISGPLGIWPFPILNAFSQG